MQQKPCLLVCDPILRGGSGHCVATVTWKQVVQAQARLVFLHISAKLLLPLREMSTSPHRPPLEGEAEVFCFDEGGMGVPSSKRSQPVPSLDMGGGKL